MIRSREPGAARLAHRRVHLLWLVWLALIAGATSPAGAAGKAWIEISVAADSAHAIVSLDRPVKHFAFAEASVAWKGYAQIVTPGLALKGRVVEGTAPFRHFELRLRPSREEQDARYPAHYRIGEGGVVYAPALAADPAQWRSRVRFRTTRGQVRYPASSGEPEGFVFLGPRQLVSVFRDVVVVADPAMPAWLAARARSDLEAAVRTYGAALGMPLRSKPLLLLKHQDGDRNFNVGDVTPGPVVALRFHGAAWKTPDATAARGIQAFILHEAFHFWNGGLAAPADGTPTWLHEGGAEYAALLAGPSAGVMDESAVRQRLTEALNRCRFALQNEGDKGLAEIGFLSNQLRYPCGMVLQWAIDLHVRRAAGGRTLLDVWAETIRNAVRRPGRKYGLADFYRAAGIRSTADFEPAALLVETSGPERWRALGAALNGLGAEVVQTVTPPGRRAAAIFHLLRQSCTALPAGTGFGFYTDAATVKLDSPSGCGVIAGDPVLKTIEGGDPFTLSDQAYAAVQRRCAAREPVRIVTADGRALSVPCTEPLPPAPADYSVIRWRPGAAARLD